MAKSRARWWIIGIIIALLVIGMWVAAFALVATGRGTAATQDYDETLLVEDGGEGKIAMISITGVISTGSDTCLPQAAIDNQIVAELDQALNDDEVLGVILELETPGGGVVASENIYRKVREVRDAEMPVIALMGEVAASGGYYISAAANEIVANQSTITGSVGVITIVPNIEGTADKIGITTEVIKSGPHKDIGSPLRGLEDDERQIFQTLIDEAYDRFVEIVADGRGLEPGRVREIADGRIYSGKQALDLGLVDHLGGRELAFERAKALANAPGADLVRYECSAGFADLFSPFARSRTEAVKEELGFDLGAGLQYLWVR